MAPAGIAFTKDRLEKGLTTSWVIDKEGEWGVSAGCV